MRSLFILVGFSLLVGCASSTVYTDDFDDREPAAISSIKPLVKVDQKAANGSCIKKVKNNKSILVKHRVSAWSGYVKGRVVKKTSRITSLNDKRVKAVANIYATMESFKNRKFQIPNRMEFVFGKLGESRGPSRTQGKEVLFINPGIANARPMKDKRYNGADNHALIAHMMAYQVANRLGGYIKQYRRKVGPKSCPVSRYALRPNFGYRTHFAEAFAAYLTHPELLNKPGCKRTFAFMKNLFGETNNKITCLSRQKRFNSGVDSLTEETQGSGIDAD